MEDEEIIDIFQSELVPKHDIMSEDEKSHFLSELNITTKQLPKISQDDPIVKRLNAKKGDVIKVSRNDPNVGEYNYYRVVV
jgi:DNA-directed RNA polymerase subunit H (RpoH/RPB5)